MFTKGGGLHVYIYMPAACKTYKHISTLRAGGFSHDFVFKLSWMISSDFKNPREEAELLKVF